MNTSLPKLVLPYSGCTSQSQEFLSFFQRWMVLFIGLSIFSFGSFGQTVSVTSVTPDPICAGSAVTVTFSTTNGTIGNHYTNGTSYQAYLSDNAGNNFAPIGSAFTVSASYNTSDAGVTSGLQQSVTIPAGTVSGAGYKISIGSTSPTFVGSAGANASST